MTEGLAADIYLQHLFHVPVQTEVLAFLQQLFSCWDHHKTADLEVYASA